MKPDFSLCIKCKGRLWCGLSYCPLIAKAEAYFKASKNIESINSGFFGSSPGIFVGHNNYPKLGFGILSPAEKTSSLEYDNPHLWSENNYNSRQIISLRSSLINSRSVENAHKSSKLVELGQEIAMAKKPVDVEISLKQKPRIKLNISSYYPPTGPTAKLKKARITENPRISRDVEKAFYDTDLKANHALLQLYKKGYDENFLAKVLSSGALGIKKQRKLVPTRWSITATHDSIANALISEIKQYGFFDYSAFFSGYLGNYYLLLFFPEPYSYELFEAYMPKTSWNASEKISYTTDYEPHSGRKSYAENCAGGFYSVRLSVAEYLKKNKKQASVLAIRVITEQYAVPLGVWVTAEAARKALKQKPLVFSSKELLLKYAKALIKNKFSYDISHILEKSIILRELRQQKKLTGFFS